MRGPRGRVSLGAGPSHFMKDLTLVVMYLNNKPLTHPPGIAFKQLGSPQPGWGAGGGLTSKGDRSTGGQDLRQEGGEGEGGGVARARGGGKGREGKHWEPR